MNRSASFILLGIAAALLFVSMFFFVVNERELAIKFRLGEFERADYSPGIYFKIPVYNKVHKFDRRILTLDAEPERYLTLEKKNVIVDSFVKWRIRNVEVFYKTMAGDARQANLRLSKVIKDGLRSEFGKRTIQEAVSGERSEIMKVITDQIQAQAKDFGIEVLDVRVKRIELPAEVSGSVYRRMEAERARVAKDLRSKGAEVAEKIRADADRQRTVILAEAYRDAERLRGEGDGKATEIYAKAFGQDEEFYGLYQSLKAYDKVFSQKDDLLVLDPRSEFFDYFGNAKGKR